MVAAAPPPPPPAEVAPAVPPAIFPGSPPAAASPYVPGVYVEQGIASWYGEPFHGRRAANGEIFDMNTMVAAHRTMPFGSMVRVTNLNNGRQAEVRIIDRGPFIEGRVLDLAYSAAQALGMIGSGIAPVRIELLSGPAAPTGDFAVQVGAFADRANADRLRDRLRVRYQPVVIEQVNGSSARLFRVLVGRLPTLDAAQQMAVELKSRESVHTFIVRLDQAMDFTD